MSGTCKLAHIIPIHKGKIWSLPNNNWPVALTSHLIKVFEKVVRRHLVDFMNTHRLFNHSQHGFRGGRSYLSQLINHLDHITSLLKGGSSVDVIYLDFAKAISKVDIGTTFRKFKSLGIRGQFGRWLVAFLLGRQLIVIVDGCKLLPCPVVSGVPQGSVLGPLLFLVLIEDIDGEVATSLLSSFADDTRIGRQIQGSEDVQELQADLEKVYEWAITNNKEFNPFAPIGRYLTSKGKVKVKVICLNISFLT